MVQGKGFNHPCNGLTGEPVYPRLNLFGSQGNLDSPLWSGYLLSSRALHTENMPSVTAPPE